MKNESSTFITEIKIIDKIGGVKRRFSYKNKSATQLIDVSGLPMDTYVVQAFTGTEWLSAQLLIVKNL